MMRADICSPELAKYIRGELDELVVDGKDDIWALGVLALYLTTGQHPFPVVEDGADLPAKVERIAALQEEDIAAAISEAGVEKGKQLESFLLKCLQLERAQRSTARQLMTSGYISGSSATQSLRDGGAAMLGMKQELIRNQEAMMANQEQMLAQLDRALGAIDTLQNIIVDLDKQEIPLIFGIFPEPVVAPSILEALKDPTNVGKVEHAAGAVKDLFSKFKGIFDTDSSLEMVGNMITEFSPRPMKLHLLCQKTWQPVGEGYEIKTPREIVPKLLPLLGAAVKGMKTVNGIAKVGQWFGLPSWAQIPEAWSEAAESAVDGLKSATSEYKCVAEAAGGFSPGDVERKTELSDYQVREFKKFLEDNNPVMKVDDHGHRKEEYWQDLLVKVVAKKDGRVLWVSAEGKRQLEEEALSGPEPQRRQTEVEPQPEPESDDAPHQGAQELDAARTPQPEPEIEPAPEVRRRPACQLHSCRSSGRAIF